jgi:hypothetical protein
MPTEGPAAHNIHSSATTIADLLVEDLTLPSTSIRQEVLRVLESLVSEGILMQVEDEFRLQTRESTEWEQEYKNRFIRIKSDNFRIDHERSSQIKLFVNEFLKGISLVQGVSKTPRKFELHYGDEAPSISSNSVPIWVRNEWGVSEKVIREDAQREGIESPIVFVSLPKLGSDALREALSAQLAAQETIETRRSKTSSLESQEACNAMEAKQRNSENRVRGLVESIVKAARVYQGEGVEVNENGFKASTQVAINAALYHLFPEIDDVDHSTWGTVVRRAAEGAADPLSVIGYNGDPEQHRACKKVRECISNTGTSGGEIRKKFMNPPFGWSQDAIDGYILNTFFRERRSFVAKTKAECLSWIEKFRSMVVDSSQETETFQTMSVYLAKWLKQIGMDIRPTILYQYNLYFEKYILPRLGRYHLYQVRLQMIQDMYSELHTEGIGARTMQIINNVLHHTLEDAYVAGYLKKNTAQGARHPKVVHKEMKFYNEDQVNQMLLAAQDDPSSPLPPSCSHRDAAIGITGTEME